MIQDSELNLLWINLHIPVRGNLSLANSEKSQHGLPNNDSPLLYPACWHVHPLATCHPFPRLPVTSAVLPLYLLVIHPLPCERPDTTRLTVCPHLARTHNLFPHFYSGR